MCGIVGYLGPKDGVPLVMDGLSRLEYRGYDSAGLASISRGETEVVRAKGKLAELRTALHKHPLSGGLVMGHTRWATHGAPSVKNAHPHRAGPVTVVHNGIFENAGELRAKFAKSGTHFHSETDTEVFAALVEKALKTSKSLAAAVRKALSQASGAYAVLVASEDEPGTLVAARWGCPLVAGIGSEKGESYFASDIPALLSYTREIVILEDGEMAVAGKSGLTLSDFAGKKITREPRKIAWDPVSAEKGGYKHFMLKEIHEQPQALVNTIGAHFDASKLRTTLGDLSLPERPARVVLIACGTSYHAALVGKHWIERLAGVPVEVDIASEYRYREPLVQKTDLCVFLSQSGETADTLAALKLARSKKAFTLAIANVPDSSIPRAAHATLYTYAGPEIGVAATKTFLAQLTALFILALHLGTTTKKLKKDAREALAKELLRIPAKIERTLALDEQIEAIAHHHNMHRDFLFLGRGVNHPIALEGALKLKEISYIHAEGYAAGEMKHGPIALLDEEFPVICLAPKDDAFPKVASNVEEIRARSAPVLIVTSEDLKQRPTGWDELLVVPKTDPLLYPFLLTPPLQLLSYHIANLKGCDVDQPRNLAKSVTVE
ncbi:MAG: glutamine--fructose-6-phosphate transaminase (isomerizing) [Chrysiogenetes bacterium]|nr:glutamine--fructose-6-phosphate transaminase (isomerizing) [Chrysiogenetes bacterium]